MVVMRYAPFLPLKIMLVVVLSLWLVPQALAQQPFGWTVGPTAWTFKSFTFFEAVEKTAALGMAHIEAFEGQLLMPGADTKLAPGIADDAVAALHAKLNDAKVHLINIYIHRIPNDDTACREIFEFAKKLGVSAIVSEPEPEALDLIEGYCDSYGINVALHNHPEGSSRYWHPDVIMEVLEGRGPRLGACADTGHWLRSGLNPTAMLRILGKRLMTVHMKDLDAAKRDANDVPWGEGCGELDKVLEELAACGAVPLLFGIEYEADWQNNMPQVAASRKWFAETAQKIAGEMTRSDPLFVGWASADITPDQPVAIIGQYNTRLSEGAIDPITLTALALETRFEQGAKEEAVLVSCDLCFVDNATVNKIRAAIKPRIPDFDPNKLVVSATHTHDGPGLDDATYEGVYDISGAPDAMTASEYGAFFVEKAADTIVAAWESRSAAGVSWALGHAVVGINRRVQYFDGKTVMYGDTNREEFMGFEGSADSGLPLLFFWTPEKELTGVLVNLPCPSQETESLLQLSADFWHEIRGNLRQRLGSGLYILPQCSAAGDISPHRTIRKAAEEAMLKRKGISYREEVAFRVANAIDEVLPGAREEIQFEIPMQHRLLLLDLPEKDPPTPPFIKGDSVKPTEIHALRIGEIAMATFPFEYYLDYGLRIQARAKAILTLTVQLANGQSGYLPTEEAIKGGGYSAENYLVTPEGGQLMVDEVVPALNMFWP